MFQGASSLGLRFLGSGAKKKENGTLCFWQLLLSCVVIYMASFSYEPAHSANSAGARPCAAERLYYYREARGRSRC